MTSYEGQISADGSPSGQPRSRDAPLRENQNKSGSYHRPLTGRERMVLSLQLRGLKPTEIASTMRLQAHTIYNIQARTTYQEVFQSRLDETDQYFLALKPKALGAVEAALDSADELTGLRGAETWFKAMGYKGFGKSEAPSAPVSAEDIATQLLAAGGGKMTIEVERSETRLDVPTQGHSPE